MKVVIVFESMFGNTAALVDEVTAGLADAGADIALADVAAAPGQVLLGCDLVVLAVPTHALTLRYCSVIRTSGSLSGADKDLFPRSFTSPGRGQVPRPRPQSTAPKVEWDHRARYGADYDTRYLGTRMNTWMDPDIRQELLGCWGHLDVVDPAIALRKDHQPVCHGRHARGIGVESP